MQVPPREEPERPVAGPQQAPAVGRNPGRPSLTDGQEGFAFLGCHLHKRMSGKLLEMKGTRRYYLQRWPSAKSMRRVLRAGRADAWTRDWSWNLGMHRTRGTVGYPKPCTLHEKTTVKPWAGNPHARFERRRVETGRQ